MIKTFREFMSLNTAYDLKITITQSYIWVIE